MPAVRETTAGDELFRLPLSEFTAARNALAAKLKKDGDSEESDRIKALSKPPVSAWVANQLYWKHRGAFDRQEFLRSRLGGWHEWERQCRRGSRAVAPGNESQRR